MTGPSIPLRPAAADQAATALARSDAGKITAAIDSVAGMTRAAPTPIIVR